MQLHRLAVPLFILVVAYTVRRRWKYFQGHYLEIDYISWLISMQNEYLGPSKLENFNIHSIRFEADKSIAALQYIEDIVVFPELKTLCHTVDVQIPVDEEGVSILATIYDCTANHGINNNHPQQVKKSKPVIIWYHGGGWSFNNVKGDTNLCKKLSLYSDAIVISIDYRLAPEFPYPIPVNDCYRAYLWTMQHLPEYSPEADMDRIIIAGESAGGNLAIVTILQMIEAALPSASTASPRPLLPHIKSSLLVYPATDNSTARRHIYSDIDGMLPKLKRDYLRDCYQGTAEDYLFAPLYAPSSLLQYYPPSVLIIAKHDVLTFEGLEFMKRVETAGVQQGVQQQIKKNEVIMYNASVHGFYGRWVFSEGNQAVRDSGAAIQRLLR